MREKSYYRCINICGYAAFVLAAEYILLSYIPESGNEREIVNVIFAFIKLKLYLCGLMQIAHLFEGVHAKDKEEVLFLIKMRYMEGLSAIVMLIFVIADSIYFKQYSLEMPLYVKAALGIFLLIITILYSRYKEEEHDRFEDMPGCAIKDDETYIPYILNNLNDNLLAAIIGHELYTYATRARFYKRAYYISAFITLIAPAVVIILNNVFDESDLQLKMWISILSGLATIASGVAGIVKFKESWIRYRSNCEKVKHELAYYVGECGIYSGKDNKKKSKERKKDKRKKLIENVYKHAKAEQGDWNKLTSIKHIITPQMDMQCEEK